MPVFTEETHPYEILIRFDEATGALKGAHQQRITVVKRDGAVIQAVIGEAAPVDLVDFGASGLMSEAMAAALAANANLQGQVAALTAERDGLAALASALTVERDALTAERDALAARVAAQDA
ncbi:hypothetical protein M2360_000940 [Rhizobium sp. SG_E_25_P2]|uniref:hypothetical protein n=1 Tax=Rhizobium sp. SG_E_25_P2 TaxID=2879942 RepID=UPI0024740F55|nr:hypothetical protein [Rhizobium sp. SG_E_25_P2]MDH6265550.1 hypothetical protein [Rhizobium sp. SG_E_25_P2]